MAQRDTSVDRNKQTKQNNTNKETNEQANEQANNNVRTNDMILYCKIIGS